MPPHLILCIAFLAGLLCCRLEAQTLEQQSFLASTHLLDARTDTALSIRARALREGGYETAAGEAVTFARWYSTDVPEVQVSWLTQINRNLGIIWGVGTGERAEKYTIAPSIRIGFAYSAEPRRNARVSIVVNAIIGGELREQTCTADYGDIGGIREVNCRLAASPLEPEETLNYLESAKPESTVQLRYTLLF